MHRCVGGRCHCLSSLRSLDLFLSFSLVSCFSVVSSSLSLFPFLRVASYLTIRDFVSCVGVCRAWRSAFDGSVEENPDQSCHLLAWAQPIRQILRQKKAAQVS